MNEFHRRSIGTAFQHIDARLSQIEAILQAVGGQSPLSAYTFDIGRMEQRGITGYLQRIRERMWGAMQRLEISEDRRRISAAWAVKTALLDVSITLAEIEPRRLLGYGALDEESATMISGILSDLDRITSSLDAYLTRAQDGDVAERVERLETTPVNREVIAAIEGIIHRHGLVELRSPLEAILSRLESRDLEIAVFGRVSSGKSSLLNHFVGQEILPVGVLPVTAVLTRLRRTEKPQVILRTEISPPREIALEDIADFVTEDGNPGNTRRVVDVTVGLPSERMSAGVVFIDTPGVGSLATVGAVATKAYLPSCDLGVLLVDAGSPLDEEDIALLQAMAEAAVPSMVVVSKADLLSAADRNRVATYIARMTRQHLGREAEAHFVSTRGTDATLTDRWFAERIKPIMADHTNQLERSVQRKLDRLARLACSLLRVRLDRLQRNVSDLETQQVAAARQAFRQSDEKIASVAALLTRPLEEGIAESVARFVAETAAEVVKLTRTGEEADGVLKKHAAMELAMEAEVVRSRLEDLRCFLMETAAQLRKSLGLNLPGTREMTDDPMSALPLADESRLASLADASCSRLLAVWPAMARCRVQRTIQLGYAGELWSIFRDYRERLRRWTEQELRRATNAFEAEVALFREQIDGAAGESEANNVKVLQADIATLQSLLPSLRRPGASSSDRPMAVPMPRTA